MWAEQKEEEGERKRGRARAVRGGKRERRNFTIIW
jgi:hypothetical protein